MRVRKIHSWYIGKLALQEDNLCSRPADGTEIHPSCSLLENLEAAVIVIERVFPDRRLLQKNLPLPFLYQGCHIM
jgi:hypothetical protein